MIWKWNEYLMVQSHFNEYLNLIQICINNMNMIFIEQIDALF